MAFGTVCGVCVCVRAFVYLNIFTCVCSRAQMSRKIANSSGLGRSTLSSSICSARSALARKATSWTSSGGVDFAVSCRYMVLNEFIRARPTSRSAKFLEDMDKAITGACGSEQVFLVDSHRGFFFSFFYARAAKERKEALKVIDVDNSGKMAMIEYLLWKYKKTVSAVANASQGGNAAEIAECQRKIAEVQAALEDVMLRLEQQKTAHAEAQAAARAANAALEAQKAGEARVFVFVCLFVCLFVVGSAGMRSFR